jgi:hypothetical protein
MKGERVNIPDITFMLLSGAIQSDTKLRKEPILFINEPQVRGKRYKRAYAALEFFWKIYDLCKISDPILFRTF